MLTEAEKYERFHWKIFFGSPWGDQRWGRPSPWPLRGNNSIVQAAWGGKVGAVRHLLRTVPGAAAATDGFGDTALHGAAERGHAEICRVLLAARAPLDARTVHGLLAEDCDAGRRFCGRSQ